MSKSRKRQNPLTLLSKKQLIKKIYNIEAAHDRSIANDKRVMMTNVEAMDRAALSLTKAREVVGNLLAMYMGQMTLSRMKQLMEAIGITSNKTLNGELFYSEALMKKFVVHQARTWLDGIGVKYAPPIAIETTIGSEG